MSAWASVAKLVRTKNLEGGLVVRPTTGLPFVLKEGAEVFFVPPVLEGVRSSQVQCIQPLHDGSYFVRFNAIDSIDQAKPLVGSFCLVNREDIPTATEVTTDQSWVGFEVLDETEGLLGQVVEVADNPMQRLISVRGRFGEVLIPAVDEYVLSVDAEKQRICVRIPKDLLLLSGKDKRLE